MYLILLLLLCFLLNWGSTQMTGEPINPRDFENYKLATKSTTVADKCVISTSKLRSHSSSNHHHKKLWTDGQVPYLIDSEFTERERANIAKAINIMKSTTCVNFVFRTQETDYVYISKIKEEECDSNVGVEGGKQTMRLGSYCVQSYGHVLHEFMHILGFEHEHCRPDRDQYVKIHWKNILKGYAASFKKFHHTRNTVTEYDSHSITHYSRTGDTKNNLPTITSLANPKDSLGQRTTLTKIDNLKINKLYQCIQKRQYANSSISTNGTDGVLRKFIFSTCEDFDPVDCPIWNNLGYCNESPIFMNVYCKKSCKKCGMPCSDMRPECTGWASKGYCSKYSDYMYHFCQKSCNKCTLIEFLESK